MHSLTIVAAYTFSPKRIYGIFTIRIILKYVYTVYISRIFHSGNIIRVIVLCPSQYNAQNSELRMFEGEQRALGMKDQCRSYARSTLMTQTNACRRKMVLP